MRNLIAFSTICLLVTVQQVGGAILSQVSYNVKQPLYIDMLAWKDLNVTLTFSNEIATSKCKDAIMVLFNTTTISPQFRILHLEDPKEDQLKAVKIKIKDIVDSKYSYNIKIKVHATYIGHANLKPVAIRCSTNTEKIPLPDSYNLHVIVVHSQGVWGTIFIVSVIVLISLTYVNIGAQLDIENIKQTIKKPKAVVFGFLTSVFVMPAVSWYSGQWILGDQLLYRVGSFVFACCPAATASTLWTVMLDADKELSVALQVASTIGALFTMPLLLFLMDTSLHLEGDSHAIKVPYVKLVQALFILLVALFIGWRFVGQNKSAQKISGRIFKPLTFFVLLYIIMFSSIVYWYIYQMFDWTLTLVAFIITVSTFLVSGLLGYLMGFKKANLDHAIAISIGSTYKNSGIAFGVLLVSFNDPDAYIAYVPCLTQVVTTSLALYSVYSIVSLVKCVRRRGQPDPITASTEVNESDIKPKEGRSGSSGEKSTKSENDEFIVMNLTDVIQGSPVVSKAVKTVTGIETGQSIDTEDSKTNEAS